MSTVVRLVALAALATVASSGGASAQLSKLQFSPQLSTLAKPAPQSLQLCRWVRYTEPYIYDKNTCTGEVRVVLR